MEKILSVYRKTGIRKNRIAAVLIVEAAYFIICFICAFILGDFGESRMYTTSIIGIIIGITVILCIGRWVNLPQGIELVDMLDYYPLDSKKIYALFIRENLIFSGVHMAVSIFAAFIMNNQLKSYIIMIAADIIAALYYILCLWMGYGQDIDKGEEGAYSIGTVYGVCFVMSPFFIIAAVVLYKLL